jgi:hypothetical protein
MKRIIISITIKKLKKIETMIEYLYFGDILNFGSGVYNLAGINIILLFIFLHINNNN